MPTSAGEWQTLTRDLAKQAAAVGQPISGAFELTGRCNLACSMCYVREPVCNRLARSSELSAAQWLAVAREATDAGMLFLLLTGGEVLVRPDFFEIYEPLTELGLSITLFTNGTLITEEAASRLASAAPNRLEITLYGASAAVYEAVTGVPGSFRRCITGIERLLHAGIVPGLKTTLTRTNIRDLPAMKEMAAKWGLHFAYGSLLTPRRDGRDSAARQLRLSAAEHVELEASDPATLRAWREALGRPMEAPQGNSFVCDAGRSSFVVGPAGEMNVCIDLPRPGARVLEDGFRNAWAEVRAFVQGSPPPPSACRTCAVNRSCAWCPARASLETGDPQRPAFYLCEIAYERDRRFRDRPA
ncbi:MAG TPA: radical SAM protein [Thermoanaerobaculaceae bacterium]|nr:radical SAM protein [Thermoanaerobaculaceae bacterium]